MLRAAEGILMGGRASVVGVLIAVVLLVAPSIAAPQATRTVPQVAMLLTGSPSDGSRMTAAFREGLRDLGYVEGQTIAVIPRWADIPQSLSELATEVVRNNIDVIVTQGTPAAQAAKRATSTIPIIMATSGDPVAVGLVASLARPGGNVTGNTILAPDLNGKRLELIRELVPGVSRIAVLSNPTNPATAVDIKAAEAAASRLGVSLHVLEVRDRNDFDRAFKVAKEVRAGALLVQADPLILASRTRVAELAVGSRLPAVFGFSGFAEAGGLADYGPDLAAMFRRAAVYVDKILKGAKPADLPVEQPTRLELVINMATAKALGLQIPPSVLLRAHRVIN
jgi:putative tryptophan/tyrosine transport system substrate-binding protein